VADEAVLATAAARFRQWKLLAMFALDYDERRLG
jgi:hypothetical protein